MFIEEKAPGEVKEMDEASKLLLKAADCIERSGHVKHDVGEPSRGFCVLGAVIYSVYGSAYAFSDNPNACWTDSMSAALERLRQSIGTTDEVTWNNHPERTKDEVIAKLRAVALGG